MEVKFQMPSSPSIDYNFHSGRSSPSSPRPFSNHFLFLSAPTSPSRSTDLENDLYNQSSADVDDFAFHVSSEIEAPTASAEELFDRGIIRSWNNPADSNSSSRLVSPPGSPPSSKSKGKKSFWSQFTTRRKKQTNPNSDSLENTEELRGRNRVSTPGSREARSLSPIRVSKYPWEDNKKEVEDTTQASSSSTVLTLSTNLKSSKRWRLKDLLLFRSASEGRAADKDPLRKLTVLYSRQQEIKRSSFGSVSRRANISAHERHYAMNKAVSDDMKKKTFLPYKQGILGSFHGLGGY